MFNIGYLALHLDQKSQKETLGPRFLLAAKSTNPELQDVMIDALLRQRG